MNVSLTFSKFLGPKTFSEWPNIVVLFWQYRFWSARIFYKALLFCLSVPWATFFLSKGIFLLFLCRLLLLLLLSTKVFLLHNFLLLFLLGSSFPFLPSIFLLSLLLPDPNNFLLQKFPHFHHCFPSPFNPAKLPRIVFLLCSACVLSIFLSNLFSILFCWRNMLDEDIKAL